MNTQMRNILSQLKAVAEPTRLRLLAICAQGELSVSEITEVIGQSQPRVSRHLKLLCDAGLLDRYREQHWVLYRVADKGEGAQVARQLLSLLPAESPELQRDRERMGSILRKRERLVSRIISSGPAQLEGVAEIAAHRKRLDAAVLEVMGERAPGELLDIGTGSGCMLALLAERATDAIGIDISRDMLLVARDKLRAAGVEHVSVRQGDMYSLRFPPASFDTVTMDLVLSHAEQPLQVISEARRVLRAEGVLLIVDFADEEAGISNDKLQGWWQEAGLSPLSSKTVLLGNHKLGIWLARTVSGEKVEAA